MAIMQALMMGVTGAIEDTTVVGELWAAGINTEGNLGIGDVVNKSIISQVSGTTWQSKIAFTSAGAQFNITSDGKLWATGTNVDGVLGVGDVTSRSVFTQVGSDTDWDQISAGDKSAAGVKTDGKLYTWGSADYHCLGHGDAGVHRSVPTQVGSDTDWAGVLVAGRFVVAIKTTGKIYVWGTNTVGNLGLGDVVARSAPVQIGSDTDWLGVGGHQISAADLILVAIKTV